MKRGMQFMVCLSAISCMALTCNKQKSGVTNIPVQKDTSLVNMIHLDYLYTPVNFLNGSKAAGIYIYSEAPDYHLVADADEGYTCVDDVSRAVLVYVRSPKFITDTAIQNKAYHLIEFILQMQSANGYFYNFILPGNQINTSGITSINNAGWWSWRALHTLTEANEIIKNKNLQLSTRVDQAVDKIITKIKTDQVNLPQTTKTVSGITVPQWLPAGSATDQAAILILGLIPYCTANSDAVLTAYIKKLSDGIVLMQQCNTTHFPYGAFPSWENIWHAYACDQAYALLKAGTFLNDQEYITKALIEIDNFYPWLLQNGFKSSFIISNDGTQVQLVSEKDFEQIAYGVRPMVFAAAEAFRLTGQTKYADIAGHLAAWFLGANVAGKEMYSLTTGRCYDAINSASVINFNSGAESTIEALLTMEMVEKYPTIKAALNKYKKQ